MSRLTQPNALKDWQLMIRCIHQRGADQEACLAELARRGLWLSAEQRAQADLPPQTGTF